MKLNVKEIIQFAAYMDLLKTLTVCLLLCIAAINSSMDQKDFIYYPLQSLNLLIKIVMLRPIAITCEYLMWKTNPKTKIRSDLIEYYYIQKAMIKIASLLGAAYGGRAISLLSIPLVVQNKHLDDVVHEQCKSFSCIFVFCGIRNTSEYVKTLKEDFPLYINRIFCV